MEFKKCRLTIHAKELEKLTHIHNIFLKKQFMKYSKRGLHSMPRNFKNFPQLLSKTREAGRVACFNYQKPDFRFLNQHLLPSDNLDLTGALSSSLSSLSNTIKASVSCEPSAGFLNVLALSPSQASLPHLA